jgi:hypothetical protein
MNLEDIRSNQINQAYSESEKTQTHKSREQKSTQKSGCQKLKISGVRRLGGNRRYGSVATMSSLQTSRRP